MKFKSMSQYERNALEKLLHEASMEMLSYGDTPLLYSSYETAEKLGAFIEKIAQKIVRGEDDYLPELWNIFAPTCEWDDSGGSVKLGSQIFKLLSDFHIN